MTYSSYLRNITLGLYLITGAKVKTDRRDAYALAKLLLVAAVPAAYIYPVETRLAFPFS
jgi:hypothetical protein